jgi:hypothetical protein
MLRPAAEPKKVETVYARRFAGIVTADVTDLATPYLTCEALTATQQRFAFGRRGVLFAEGGPHET